VLTSYKAAPHNRYQPHPAEPDQNTKCSNVVFVLLKMGITIPETCWDRSNNKHLIVASCWFFLSSYFAHNARSQEPKAPKQDFFFATMSRLALVTTHCTEDLLVGVKQPVSFMTQLRSASPDSSGHEECCLLGCDTVRSGISVWTPLRNLLTSSWGQTYPTQRQV